MENVCRNLNFGRIKDYSELIISRGKFLVFLGKLWGEIKGLFCKNFEFLKYFSVISYEFSRRSDECHKNFGRTKNWNDFCIKKKKKKKKLKILGRFGRSFEESLR